MAHNIFNAYEKFCNLDFSNQSGPKRVTTKKQDREIVKLSTVVKQLTTQQIAHKLTAKWAHMSVE